MQELKPSIAESLLAFDKNMDKAGLSIPEEIVLRDNSVTMNAKVLSELNSDNLGDSNDSNDSDGSDAMVCLSSRSQVRTDDGPIASIQRPEPLGKAKAEVHLISGQSYGSQVDTQPTSDVDPTLSAVISSPSTVSEQTEDGLNEQEFPVRVPLSISEGGNSISTMVVQHPSNNSDKDVQLSIMNINGSSQSDGNEATAVDKLWDTDVETSTDQGVRVEFDAKTKQGPKTPISILIEPSYKSSVALLEELKRRRLKFDRIAEKIENNDRAKPNHKIDPIEFAENAMKASNLLSTKTAKSLKKASLVLKAVEEHRSPPTDLSSSLSVDSSKVQSSSRYTDSDISFSTDGSSKDSIDELIEARLKGSKSLSGSSILSHGRLYVEDRSSTTKSSGALSSGNQSQNSRNSETKGVQKSDERASVGKGDVMYSSQTKMSSMLSDGTSSELMQLDEVTDNADSPQTLAIADRFKSQTNDISPIERQTKLQVIANKNFRSSSRMRSGEIAGFKSGDQISDAEIVKLHRSLGAGTVTPLPSAREGARNSKSSPDISYTRKSTRLENPVSLGHDSAFSLTPDSSERPNTKKKESNQDPMTEGSEVIGLDLNQRVNTEEESQRSINLAPKLIGDYDLASRGIYDIRDSTGPGSNNRRRALSGKVPVRQTHHEKDPFDVYVTEESKSDLSFVLEKEDRGETVPEKEAQDNTKPGISARNHTLSSMSSEFPVLSYDEDEDSPLERRAHDQRPLYGKRNEKVSSADSEKSANRTDIRLIDAKRERNSLPESTRPTAKSSHEQTRASTVRAARIHHKGLNRLWEKFRDTFDRDHDGSGSDVLGKIERLNELLNQNSVCPEKSVVEPERLRSSRYSKRPEKFTHVSKLPAESKIESKPSESYCPNCNKRNAETNCPTPIPFDKQSTEQVSEQPLLLHMWTQTTPYVKSSKEAANSIRTSQGGSDNTKTLSSTLKPKDMEVELRLAPQKENIQLQANSFKEKVGELKKTEPSSWNVIFEEKSRRNVSSEAHTKPPVPQISKGMVQSDVPRKPKEPVFTAWFQSTRSDTSSGTVIPLSTVPKLADAYKESKVVPKLLMKDNHPKNTE